ncbi:M23 family metallopeptidase [Streptomyces jumonjinensis]|uniref:M23 family metallopeptidase n=1 Tax=Streptomyces jumonjinensis TaxID=1945 RepID=A0A646KTI0_STRJU|nr:M23 family metallopeptidase [Streptomyces jumonjinensis]MQT05604.1 M23 family metallopeptidase [Streptomyces jumonjinensis]
MRVTLRRPRLSDLRTRSALLAAGVGTAAVLGAGAAFAAETGTTAAKPVTATTSSAVAAQAQAQAKAAETKAAAKPAAAKPAAAATASTGWSKPVADYALSATYGNSGSMWASKHSGQDFAVPSGTPVKSVGPGTVVKAGPNGAGDGSAYGNAVVVKHGDVYSQYAHLSSVNVKVGQQVSGGEQIALSGNTGNSSGPHLHFEIRTTPDYGTAIDPISYLRSQGVTL